MSVQINTNNVRMTKSQQNALAGLVRTLAGRDHDNATAGHDIVNTFDVEATSYGKVWVKVTRDMPSLSPGNMLRFEISSERWFVQVGPMGGKVAHIYPRSIAQFAGKSWCGINIAKR